MPQDSRAFTSSLRQAPHEIALPTFAVTIYTRLMPHSATGRCSRCSKDRWQPGVRVLEVGSGSGGAASWTDEAHRRRRHRLRAHLGANTAPEPDRAPRQRHAIPLPDASFDARSLPRHARARRDRPTGHGRSRSSSRARARRQRCCVTFPSGHAAEQLRPLARRHLRRPPREAASAGAEHLDLGLPDANEIAAASPARQERASPSSRTSGHPPGASSTAPTRWGAGFR